MIIEKNNIKTSAKGTFIFCIILIVIFISVSVFGIIVVDENIHIVRTSLIISCLFFYIIIKHYCYQAIYKVIIENGKMIFASLFKDYKFLLVEHLINKDPYRRFILMIAKDKLILYKFIFGKAIFSKKEIDHFHT